MPPSAFDALAESLAGTFPGCEDAPLARALLHQLANGEPVAISRLPDGAAFVLARWPNVDYDEHGHVVAFGGLSLTPTAHRFTVGGRRLYAWCAWDSLFLPALLDRSANVESTCPVTGIDVRLTVDPDGVRRVDPQPLWVSFPPAATTPPPTSSAPSAATCTSSPLPSGG